MATQMTERYCPICEKPGQPEFNRFGEWAPPVLRRLRRHGARRRG